ncbi:U3 snoRNP-associated protein Imp3 [Schizosaccharomyces japonicus yFS275]|uniref:U3 small nucleolar ribonucleoprotein protein IMP3 n=1 Tax=Schizosaccharomyces japonicus (strain yFS275 / FY16936) TaxID=402676 RepID=B6K2A4_SCHJY|nr:U3 snoRNP-associated protein Imp3 [Schizosaccharomyces japonicus yFS275]EEB07285.1 U3 snoRNP-associated protein Imp3 [Schizosaccharomyces japonicus yFS275]
MRELKHHERKLLKKVDFLNYKHDDGNHRDLMVMRRYHISKREEYQKYNIVCGKLRQLAHKLSLLNPQDPFRLKYEELILEKLFDMGILASKSKMSDVENKANVSAICRRRLPVVMCKLRMAQNVSGATKLVEQGHVRVGPHVVTDPAYLVTRNLEDFITWTDDSKIKRTIAKYNDKLDDYDLL